tara:strand:- start:62988 stop:63185 length:198 start_codon:yes stop_codon:yes gene_type:complete
MISTYKRASIAHKTNGLLVSQDIATLAAMNVQAKIERVNNSPKMCYKMRLSAIVASDNRKGKLWE